MARAEIDQERGTATQRGYGSAHRHRFRAGVLRKHPTCTCTDAACPSHRGTSQCWQPSTVADHWPLLRRELVAAGQDADDPRHGRGLCFSCHSHATATDERTRPGR